MPTRALAVIRVYAPYGMTDMLEPLRRQVRGASLLPEGDIVGERIRDAALSEAERAAIAVRARKMVIDLRAQSHPSLMESLLAEYGLSDDEGLALMCLAEAYLRVPDTGSIDALIRDKIGAGHWSRHAGAARSMLVNASTWGLMLSGAIFRDRETQNDSALSIVQDLKRRFGEPMVRSAVGVAMRVMGQQFVLGRNIDEAIARSQKARAGGYRHSFDMLGEAARTAEAARRYFDAYAEAITRIGASADPNARVFDNAGISVKLSALHPRYETSQKDRVMAELLPRLRDLARQACRANIGFNVDAEEANRLDLSLDLVEAVLRDPALRGWDGFGIVVQAYAKTCMPVLRWFHALTVDIDCRAAVRLVKGAYWDMEIKQAQVLGLPAYPVFTRKAATDVSYLAGARFLLAHDARLYPQFASHNAHSIAAVVEMASPANRFEFQRLHGMGESLHELALGQTSRICRIYAPVGRHEDLLAYLVRRMLENGANSSFVNQLLDETIAPEVLVADPVNRLLSARTLVNASIPLPPDLFGSARRNSAGFDTNSAADAATLNARLEPHLKTRWHARPDQASHVEMLAPTLVRNPADPTDVVGEVSSLLPESIGSLIAFLRAGQPAWQRRSAAQRAAILDAIADLYEINQGELMTLLTREAGKIRVDAVAEIREAVDFCRYYAEQARRDGDLAPAARGVFVCISPWNFPLAIFTGQVAAALVTGNAVVAKPADQTPLIAARAVALMHLAGVPADVLALAPGPGTSVGAGLVARSDIDGVCFTGSTATACRIDIALAAGNPHAPLIAETGGINAMIVDSTALPEAAVRDIVQSAFQSAGQRCSALRVLFVQEDIADDLITMLAGATAELRIGDPRSPTIDVGPVIDPAAHQRIQAHCDILRAQGRLLFGGDPSWQAPYIAPVAFGLDRLDDLDREIFGPVLHVIRFAGAAIDDVVDQINATGYGLTFGLHSRIEDRVRHICARIKVGNTYVNRNQIGAVVGVQPFGGERLSGTGPKAGGPHYLSAFRQNADSAGELPALPTSVHAPGRPADAVTEQATLAGRVVPLLSAIHTSDGIGRVASMREALAAIESPWREAMAAALAQAEPLLLEEPLAGPTGETNRLRSVPRGLGVCLGGGGQPHVALFRQAAHALAMGNAVCVAGDHAQSVVDRLRPLLRRAAMADAWLTAVAAEAVHGLIAGTASTSLPLSFVCLEESDANWGKLRHALARREGTRVPLLTAASPLARFSLERVVTVDTTASGGNASLLTMAAAEDSVLS